MVKKDTQEGQSTTFEIPGATVRYRKSKVLSSLSSFSKPRDLLSISKDGMLFDSDKRLIPGTKVELQLLIPHRARVNLHGRVGWDIYPAGKNVTIAVTVHFTPFYGRWGNPKAVLEVFEELEDQYAKEEAVSEFHPVRDHLF